MQIPSEIYKLKELLDSFLGESKSDLSDNFQLQYPCPRCVEEKGAREATKYNLEINLQKGVFQCWSCTAHDESMRGSIAKLIKLYGNQNIFKSYIETLHTLRESQFIQNNFDKNDFNIEFKNAEKEELQLPSNYVPFFEKEKYNKDETMALEYLFKRGIGWDIIKKYQMGYTQYDEKQKQLSSRIILPSYDAFGKLNYWTGRNYLTKLSARQKYFNPQTERKNLIFNENKIDWDADVTLVEGPFDHIVVPNSIPLLGKVLKQDFRLYGEILTKANANINIFLDGDAFEAIKQTYSLLNHDKLYDKVRYIQTQENLDPSEIYQLYGKRGIINALRSAKKMEVKYWVF